MRIGVFVAILSTSLCFQFFLRCWGKYLSVISFRLLDETQDSMQFIRPFMIWPCCLLLQPHGPPPTCPRPTTHPRLLRATQESFAISFLCVHVLAVPSSQNTLPCIPLQRPPNPWSLFTLISRDASPRKPLLNPSDGGPLSGAHRLSHSSAEGEGAQGLTRDWTCR